MAVYNRSSTLIQVASQPHRPMMQTRAGHVDGWCLSHLPGSGCFISHYCANAHSKQVMKELYSLDNLQEQPLVGGTIHPMHTGDIEVSYLTFP